MERPSAPSPGHRRALLAAMLATTAVLLAGCGALGYTSAAGDKTKGKTLFQQKCGGCHTLTDAGTTGTIGPDLDVAFQQALATGMTEGTVRQVVRGQIAYAIDQPSTGTPGMPKNIVEGNDARDVAAYVASAAAKEAASGTAAAPPPRATTTAPTTTTTPAPSGGGGAAGGADLAAGKKVFLGAGGCSACHTLKDAGATGTVGPDLDKLKADAQTAGKPLEAYVDESIVDPNAYVVPGFPKGVMPPDFKTTLTAKQIADLVAYLVAKAGAS